MLTLSGRGTARRDIYPSVSALYRTGIHLIYIAEYLRQHETLRRPSTCNSYPPHLVSRQSGANAAQANEAFPGRRGTPEPDGRRRRRPRRRRKPAASVMSRRRRRLARARLRRAALLLALRRGHRRR